MGVCLSVCRRGIVGDTRRTIAETDVCERDSPEGAGVSCNSPMRLFGGATCRFITADICGISGLLELCRRTQRIPAVLGRILSTAGSDRCELFRVCLDVAWSVCVGHRGSPAKMAEPMLFGTPITSITSDSRVLNDPYIRRRCRPYIGATRQIRLNDP